MKPSFKPRTTRELRRDLINRNPVRWARMQKEMRYFKKYMKRWGYDPDDIRWLL